MYMRMREYNTMLLLHNYMMWREALIYYLLQSRKSEPFLRWRLMVRDDKHQQGVLIISS